METILRDIYYGVRLLIKNPAVTVIAIIALALGIGANSAIFSLANAVILAPLPYKEPDQLVTVWHTYPQLTPSRTHISPPSFNIYKDKSQVFEQAAAYTMRSYNITSLEQPEQLQVMVVSSGFFETLGVMPILGRSFLPEEHQFDNNLVVILSHGLWQRYFNSSPDAISKTVTLNGYQFRVIGVMPPHFQFVEPADIWAPLAFTPNQLSSSQHGNEYLRMVARLKQGISWEQAQTEAARISAGVRQDFPAFYPESSKWHITLTPLQDQLVKDARLSLLVLLGAVGVLLLMACANVAGLLLTQIVSRQKEFALRMALGASAGRLFRQFLTESLILSIIGGAAGLLAAIWGWKLMTAFIPSNLASLVIHRGMITTDLLVLLFTMVVSILTGLIFGTAPAHLISKIDINKSLKEGEMALRQGSGAGGSRLRNTLVVFEVTLTFILLISAGLLLRSFQRIHDVDPGFRLKNLLVMQLSLPRYKYQKRDQIAGFHRRLSNELSTVPGVEQASIVSALPLTNSNRDTLIMIEGRPTPPSTLGESVTFSSASPDYFRAMGIPLLAGRFFTERDIIDAPAVAIIDDIMAKRFWPDRDPIGQRLAMSSENTSGSPRWIEIVGKVRQVKYRGLDSESEPQLYLPLFQYPFGSVYLAVHTLTEPAGMTASIRTAVRKLDMELPIYRPMSIEQMTAMSLAARRFPTLLMGTFAGIAMTLAAIGLYGLLAYSVKQRTYEIGIRIALGAQPSNVIRLVMKDGMIVTFLGIGLGFFASLLLTRFISGMLFGVGPMDPLTFVGVSLLLIVVAILATYFPARRAVKTDPIISLRSQ